MMGQLDAETQLLALALLNYADDHGYFRAEPTLVRSACRPFSEDSVRIHGALNTLLKVGWIETCDSGENGIIGRIAKWEKHQRVNRPSPSKLKPYWFNESSVNPHGVLTEHSVQEQGTGKGKETPIVPLAGDGIQVEPEDLSETIAVVDVKPSPHINPPLLRAKAIFRIRPGTPLDAGQTRAWRRAAELVAATAEEDWSALEAYYSAEIPQRDNYRRRDLATLLNNWSGEITRARDWAGRNGISLSGKSQKNKKAAPPDELWRAALCGLYPDVHPDNVPYVTWDVVPDSLKAEILAALRAAEAVAA